MIVFSLMMNLDVILILCWNCIWISFGYYGFCGWIGYRIGLWILDWIWIYLDMELGFGYIWISICELENYMICNWIGPMIQFDCMRPFLNTNWFLPNTPNDNFFFSFNLFVDIWFNFIFIFIAGKNKWRMGRFLV